MFKCSQKCSEAVLSDFPIDEAILSENSIDFIIDLAIEAIFHCKSWIIREKRRKSNSSNKISSRLTYGQPSKQIPNRGIIFYF